MRHEDPMFLVSQRQQEKQSQHDKMRSLYERVVGPTEDVEPIKDEKRHDKKERKWDRKHHRRDEEGRSDRHRVSQLRMLMLA